MKITLDNQSILIMFLLIASDRMRLQTESHQRLMAQPRFSPSLILSLKTPSLVNSCHICTPPPPLEISIVPLQYTTHNLLIVIEDPINVRNLILIFI